MAFDTAARPLWTYSHPDTSLVVTEFSVGKHAEVIAFDIATQRLWRLAAPYVSPQPIPLGDIGFLHDIVVLDDQTILGIAQDSLRPLVEFDFEGIPRSRSRFPNQAFNRMHAMVRQGKAIPSVTDSSWIFAFAFMDGFIKLRNVKGLWSAAGIEPVRPPQVTIVKLESGSSTKLTSRTTATFGGAATRTEILLLPGARRSDMTGSLIDRYSLRNGKYLGSYNIGATVLDIAAAGEDIIVLTNVAVLKLSKPASKTRGVPE